MASLWQLALWSKWHFVGETERSGGPNYDQGLKVPYSYSAHYGGNVVVVVVVMCKHSVWCPLTKACNWKGSRMAQSCALHANEGFSCPFNIDSQPELLTRSCDCGLYIK